MLFQTAAYFLHHHQPTSSSFQCYTSGHFDSTRWIKLRHQEYEHCTEQTDELLFKYNDPPSRCNKRKRQHRIILAKCTEDGELEQIPPTQFNWYMLCVSCPNIDDKWFNQKFCRWFRLPYNCFFEIVEEAREENWFP